MTLATRLRTELINAGQWLSDGRTFARIASVSDVWVYLIEEQGYQAAILPRRPCIERVNPAASLAARALWSTQCGEFATGYANTLNSFAVVMAEEGYPRSEVLLSLADEIDTAREQNTAIVPATVNDYWSSLPPSVKLAFAAGALYFAVDFLGKIGAAREAFR